MNKSIDIVPDTTVFYLSPQETNNLRTQARKIACTEDTESYLKSCQVLHSVERASMITADGAVAAWQHWGYPSFLHYVETELGIQRSKGTEMVRTWEVFGHHSFYPIKSLVSLGTSRVTKLARLLLLLSSKGIPGKKGELQAFNLTRKELNSWVKWAKTKSVSEIDREFSRTRQAFRNAQGLETQETALHDFHCRVTIEELTVVEKAIKEAKILGKGTRKGQVLFEICKDWVLKFSKKTTVKMQVSTISSRPSRNQESRSKV